MPRYQQSEQTKALKPRIRELFQTRKELFSTEKTWCATIDFTLPDGQHVTGTFDFSGWNWPPREELGPVYEALSRGPLAMTGARVRSSRRPPREAPPQS